MATDDYRDDVSVALRRFVQSNEGRRPSVLKVTYEDAMVWIAAEHSEKTPQEFVHQDVKKFVHTISLNHQILTDCSVELLTVDSGEESHFE